MSKTGRRSVGISLLVGVLLTSLLVGAATAAAPGGASSIADETENATTTGSWTLEELQRGGDQQAGAPPSLRWLSSSSAVYVDYGHTNPIHAAGSDGQSWTVDNLLESGGTVDKPELRLHYQGARGGGETVELHIVYYRVGEQERQTADGIVTERVPVDVVHETATVEFDQAFAVETIDLRTQDSYYDEPVNVAMWVDGSDGARWSFQYAPLRTSEAVSTTTAGERLWWLLKTFVAPLVAIGLLGASFVLYSRKKAIAGPQLGTGAWAFLIIVGGFLAILFGYEGLSTLFIRGPAVLAFLVIAILVIPLIEGMDDHLATVRFVRPTVTDATSASGEDALDAISVESQQETLAKMADGRLAIVRGGLVKWLARLFGGAAVLERGGRLKTRVFDEGKTVTDEWVWVHYDADTVVDYEPEGFDLVRGERELAKVSGAILLLGAIAWVGASPGSAYTVVALGGLAAVPWAYEVRDGTASVWYASAHERAAFTTMLYGSHEFADADTLEQARQQTYQERAKSSKEVEEVIELRDETLMHEALGLDVSAGVREDDSAAMYEPPEGESPLDERPPDAGGETDDD